MTYQEELILLLQVIGAMMLGGVIGFEREMTKRPAGFRTHMMVAGASALIVRLGEPLLVFYREVGLTELVESDPFRMIGAVVTGIAFMGAGTIIQKENKLKVRGLTTASTLLLAGVIGIATAANLWILSVALSIFSVILLQTLAQLERWMGRRGKSDRQYASKDDR